MKIELTDVDERIIAATLESGRYGSAEDAVHDAILMLALPAAPISGESAEEWKAWAAVGIEQAESGQLVDGPEAVARVWDKVKKQAEER